MPESDGRSGLQELSHDTNARTSTLAELPQALPELSQARGPFFELNTGEEEKNYGCQ